MRTQVTCFGCKLFEQFLRILEIEVSSKVHSKMECYLPVLTYVTCEIVSHVGRDLSPDSVVDSVVGLSKEYRSCSILPRTMWPCRSDAILEFSLSSVRM